MHSRFSLVCQLASFYWLLAIGYSRSGLLGQSIESGDAKFQMLFLGVFDLIVTDTVKALHEHHYGGNTGTSHFGRVMERAGRKPIRFATRFLDCFAAEVD
jgi:hypothetical protein